MPEIEQQVLKAIDLEGMLAFLSELVAIPSLTGSETEAQEHVAAQMKKCGRIQRQDKTDKGYFGHNAFAGLIPYPAFRTRLTLLGLLSHDILFSSIQTRNASTPGC